VDIIIYVAIGIGVLVLLAFVRTCYKKFHGRL
jgi:hypothetical protein